MAHQSRGSQYRCRPAEIARREPLSPRMLQMPEVITLPSHVMPRNAMILPFIS